MTQTLHANTRPAIADPHKLISLPGLVLILSSFALGYILSDIQTSPTATDHAAQVDDHDWHGNVKRSTWGQ